MYPCTICGLEKVEQARSGSIPKYCPSCLTTVRRQNLKSARIAKYQSDMDKDVLPVTMPDGSIARVRDEEEKAFILLRLKQYTDDFDWTASADMGMMARLILLELETTRMQRLLTLKHTASIANSLARLTEEYRKTQQDLGITRNKRINEKDSQDAPTIVAGMVKRFAEYRANHPERFKWKCQSCGRIQGLAIENPEPIKDVNVEMAEGVTAFIEDMKQANGSLTNTGVAEQPSTSDAGLLPAVTEVTQHPVGVGAYRPEDGAKVDAKK